jgi:predicted Zn-dependent protease
LSLANVAIGASEYKQYQQMTMAALGVGVQYGVILPYGRTQESEADIVGLGFMAKAGFDPNQSVDLWQNMGKAGGSQPPEFFSTHPSHNTRIRDLQATIKTLPASTVKAPKCG